MTEVVNTMVFAVVRSDLILPALKSFWEFNSKDKHRVIVIDQTHLGLTDLVNRELAHVHLRVYKNLGFAGAMNRGIRMADTRYVTVANDDIEFFGDEDTWWPGIMETFEKVQTAVGVNPSCPLIPGWGFGQKEPIYVAGIDSREKCRAEGNLETLKKETPLKGFVNGCAMWMTTFDMDRLREFGLLGDRFQLFDEKFFPGSGEDYDLLGRCAKAGAKVMGTHFSFLWHDWGMSKDKKDHDGMLKVADRPSWNRMGDLWPDGFDCWGRKGDRLPGIHIEPL